MSHLGATRDCRQCGQALPRTSFSGSQWKRGVALSVCIACVASGPDAPVVASATPSVGIDRWSRVPADRRDVDRFLKLTGMSAFGYGADVFPFLQKHEAAAVRLTSKLLCAAVDRRPWRAEVRLIILACRFSEVCHPQV